MADLTPTQEKLTYTSDLKQCARRIEHANDRMGQSFKDWLCLVGSQLRKARDLISVNGSHKSEFGRWVSKTTPWSKNYANKLIQAEERLSVLGTIVPRMIPSNEAQLRSLDPVPDNKLTEVWQEICDDAESNGGKITARRISKYVQPYKKKAKKSKDAFDPLRSMRRISECLSEEINSWPEKDRPEIIRWIKETLDKELS